MAALTSIEEIAAAPRRLLAGIELPARFSTLGEECRALREGAAVFDASLRLWVRARGEDRVSFLQGMVSNDVKALAEGQSVYAALLTQQGRVVTDLRIHAAPDHLLLDLPAQAAAAAQAALERYIVADDVELETEPVVLIGLEGPQSAGVLAAVAGRTAPQGLADIFIDGLVVRVVPASHAGEAGFLLAATVEAAPQVWRALRAAGAQPIGLEALDVLRVEAGIPWVGRDMDEDVLLMEADLPAAISFSKGCYLGQEVVERIAARGHVNRKRTGLVLRGDPVEARTPLVAGDRDVGWVTSSMRSPRLGETIAMGYVRREHLEPGTELSAGGVVARVTSLPFHPSATGVRLSS